MLNLSGKSISTLLGLFAFVNTLFSQVKDPLSYVNPFIGTANSNVFTRWGSEGGTYPGAVAPSGFVQLTPETSVGDKKGYLYHDSTIYFFSCVNHRSGYPNGSAGQWMIMPVGDEAHFQPRRYSRPFSHLQEKAEPGYYRVLLKDDSTLVEAAAAERSGIFRFTFPPGVVPKIFIGDMGEITMRSKRVFEGTRTDTLAKFTSLNKFNALIHFNADHIHKQDVEDGCVLTFPSIATRPTVIVLNLGVSAVSITGAQKNMAAELHTLSLDQLREQTRNKWLKALSVIEIDDTKEQHKTVFYTALYHTLLLPWLISDVDGNYYGDDGLVHKTTGKHEYGGFSPWDTYRTLHPLLCLLYPDRQNDMVLSMLNVFQQTGYLPIEPMTGNHAVPIIADSYLKGITGFDKDLAYTAMKKSIDMPPFIQDDLEIYQKQGYLPFAYAESVTRTVEYAYDDWVLARFAKTVMRRDDDYKRLLQRSYQYRNLFHAQMLFLLPRKENEFKLRPGTLGYKEGDQWIYTYAVPHQPKDLINLMGGNDRFVSRLDSALTHEQIIFDNETVFHVPYLFNYAGHPQTTQKWVSSIMNSRFASTPGGLPGNDDLGSMSSWYVFSAMGIFPVCPGRPVYDIGSPLFKSVTIHLSNGKTLTLKSNHSSLQNIYVKSLLVDKKKYGLRWISHGQLIKGGEIVFEMSPKPDHRLTSGNHQHVVAETNGVPDFSMRGHSVSKQKVKPNELFWIRFRVHNKGSAGTKTVKLVVNDRSHSFKNCLVDSQIALTDSISCRLYTLGKARLKIDNLKAIEVEVIHPDLPIAEQVQVDALSVKSLLDAEALQQITYTVQNIGWVPHTFYVPVFLDDVRAWRDSVRLDPGEKKTILRTLKVHGKGFHTLRVNNCEEHFKLYNIKTESLVVNLSLKNRGSDMVIDSSGFDNHGKVTGAHNNTSDAYIPLGKDRFVELLNSRSLDVTGETITMMAWVYADGKGKGLEDLLTKGDNHVLQVYGDHKLNFFAGGWGRGECTVDVPENWHGHWHHIAGVCDGNSLRVYIDGDLKGTTELGSPVNLSGSSKWAIGRNEEFPSERIFEGYMDHVKIFTEPLSQAEILYILKKEAGGMGKN